MSDPDPATHAQARPPPGAAPLPPVRSTELLRNVLDAATEFAIIATDPDGRITVFNKGAERLLGYEAAELVGRATPEAFHLPAEVEDYGRALSGRFGTTIAGFRVFVEIPERDGSEQREWHYVRKDGTHIPVSLTITAMRDEEGRISGYLGIAENITTRKQAERNAAREAEYRELMRQLSSSFISLPLEGIDTAIDRALARIGAFFTADRVYVFAYDFASGTCTNTHEWCAPGVAPSIDALQGVPLEQIDGVVAHHRRGEPLVIPDVAGLPPGPMREHLQAQQIKSLLTYPMVHEGACLGFVGFDAVTDLARYGADELQLLGLFAGLLANLEDRRRSAEALRRKSDKLVRSNRHLKNIFDSIHAAIYVADMNTHEILFVNSFLRGAVGDVVGTTCWKVLQAGMEGPCSFCTNDRLLTAAGTPTDTVVWEHFNARIGRWYQLHDRAIPWDDGRYVRMEIALDITDRKRLEADLLAAKQAAEAASLAKTRFLAAASHDLRQPMQAISLFQSALEQTVLDEEQRRITGFLGTSVRSLGELLNTLLDISRLDAGVVRANVSAVPVESIFTRIEAEFAETFLTKGLRFKLAFPYASMAVHTDAQILVSILRNLVANAAEYCKEGGVLIGVRRRGERALFEVRDTGIGIAADELERIFDEFYQIGNAERDRSKGLGLGLSIVRRLARLIDAELRVRSHPGKGSVFSVAVPLAASRNGVVALPDEIDPAHFTGCRIVIIDDDLWVGRAIEASLAGIGMLVTLHGSSDQALADPAVCEADYYVSDLRLPGRHDGLELLATIEQRAGKPINAVLLTGDTSPERIELARAAPWPVLFKPAELHTLLATLARNARRKPA